NPVATPLSPPETQREIPPANAAPSQTEPDAVLQRVVLLTSATGCRGSANQGTIAEAGSCAQDSFALSISRRVFEQIFFVPFR
ncbi:MAG: hypothetical protein LC721_02340, partial [Actinobacteria bacterium]|nr:hypothetical protein [Actinomycetota bacterium]